MPSLTASAVRIDIGSDGEILPDSIQNLKSAVRLNRGASLPVSGSRPEMFLSGEIGRPGQGFSVDDADRRSSGRPRPVSIKISPGCTDQTRRRHAVDRELVPAMWVEALFGAESHGPRDRIVDRRHDLHASAVAVKDRIVLQVRSPRWVERFAELKDERRVPVDIRIGIPWLIAEAAGCWADGEARFDQVLPPRMSNHRCKPPRFCASLRIARRRGTSPSQRHRPRQSLRSQPELRPRRKQPSPSACPRRCAIGLTVAVKFIA